MLATKPVIHSVSAGNDLVVEANCGISVEAENIEQIANALHQISVMRNSELRALGQNGNKFVREHHDYAYLATRFLSECGL